jgi:hypothetical protein
MTNKMNLFLHHRDLRYHDNTKDILCKFFYCADEIELIINEETLEWNAQYLNDFLVCKIQDIFDLLEQNCKLDNLQII